MGERSPKNHGLHPLLEPTLLPDIFPQSPFQILSGQSLLPGLTLPSPQGYMGQSLTSPCLLAPARSSLSLLSQENPHLFLYLPLATSLSPPFLIQISQNESLYLISNLLYLCFLLDLPTSGLFFKVCPLCLESS